VRRRVLDVVREECVHAFAVACLKGRVKRRIETLRDLDVLGAHNARPYSDQRRGSRAPPARPRVGSCSNPLFAAELFEPIPLRLVTLWAWVARHGDDGEFPRSSLRDFVWHGVWGGRRRRITPRMLGRFIELGLIDEHEYVDDGQQVLVIAYWRSYRPVDLTSAERKRRYRRRLYGERYYGTDGDVMEVEVDFSEIAALEAKDRAIGEELMRNARSSASLRGAGEGAPETKESQGSLRPHGGDARASGRVPLDRRSPA
jgi:hypothetical protein